MDIELKTGGWLRKQSPIDMCAGYKAKTLHMKKGDFEELRKLAYNNPARFNAVMMQLEGRFE